MEKIKLHYIYERYDDAYNSMIIKNQRVERRERKTADVIVVGMSIKQYCIQKN